MNTESISNYQEHVVFERIRAEAAAFSARIPGFGDDEDLLADVACIALNALPPRYIRHVVDMHFYMSNRERAQNDTAVKMAVEAAFNYIAKRMETQAQASRA
jgi:hypothetical protein